MPDFSPRLKRLFLCAFVAASLLAGCREAEKTPIQTETIAFTKEGELSILKAQTDSVLITLDIEIAETDYETQTGLMHRTEMADTQGMWFIFEEESMHSFYMKNTLLSLDILFVNEQLEIVTIHKNATPLDESGISSEVPIQYVLEVGAGLTDRWGVTPGDQIRFKRLP